MIQLKSSYQKIIFGLKVKQLRQAKQLSFGEFAERTGMSMSYLNEIEKGKKFPKEDKINLIASVLDTSTSELTSPQLSKNLAPLGDLLNSNFLNELPLDLFGIDLQKVVELVAEAPIKVGAFISTMVEIGRTYALREENFYYRALRAYQELNNNYFEDIENEADRFFEKYKIDTSKPLTYKQLATILKNDFQLTIVENGLEPFADLQHFRSVAIPHQQKILLNGLLNEKQKTYQLAKELGFKFLQIEERAIAGLRAQTFEEVLNNFKAAYFAIAVLIPKDNFVNDIRHFFESTTWKPDFFDQLLEKYQVSPETLFQRFNVLPRFFGIEKLFFLRFIHDSESDAFEIDKELHLYHRHQPHSNGLNEHYCRRCLGIKTIEQLSEEKNKKTTIVCDVHRSRYVTSNEEYLCFSIARQSSPSLRKNVSVTLGLQVDANLRKKIKFLDDPNIQQKTLGVTCERCPIDNCSERVKPPVRLEERAKRKKIQETLRLLSKKVE